MWTISSTPGPHFTRPRARETRVCEKVRWEVSIHELTFGCASGVDRWSRPPPDRRRFWLFPKSCPRHKVKAGTTYFWRIGGDHEFEWKMRPGEVYERELPHKIAEHYS